MSSLAVLKVLTIPAQSKIQLAVGRSRRSPRGARAPRVCRARVEFASKLSH